jgi:hypothetical protein
VFPASVDVGITVCVGVESIELGDPENIGNDVETASLSCLEREIRLFLVSRPPF